MPLRAVGTVHKRQISLGFRRLIPAKLRDVTSS